MASKDDKRNGASSAQTQGSSQQAENTARAKPAGSQRAGLGDPGEGPSTDGGLASGYSSRSSNGGTGGDVLRSRGSGYSPGDDSRVGAKANETDDLTREGVAAGAAGVGPDPAATSAQRGNDPTEGTEDYDASEGGRAVGGISGTSGGGRGTTSSGR